MQNNLNIFKDLFNKLLEEDINTDIRKVEDEDETSNKQLSYDPNSDSPTEPDENKAFNNTLDPDTDPTDYDINPNSFRAISRANIKEAENWVQVLDDFASLINSIDDEQSLGHFLNRVDREGSAFRGIVRSQGKRVTKMAEDASSIAEVLRSHIVGSAKKERELLQQFPNLKR